MSTSQSWFASNPALQIRRHWEGEDEWVIFNAASGDVHLLNAAAVTFLDRLMASPASSDELATMFGDAARDQMTPTLDLLDRLGLIRPLSS